MPRLSVSNLDLVSVTPSTIYNTGNLTTTPVRFPDATAATPTSNLIRKFVFTNKSGSAYCAVGLAVSTGSPVFVASASGVIAATEGLNIAPGSQLFLNVDAGMSVWFAASAGSTPFQALSFDSRVG